MKILRRLIVLGAIATGSFAGPMAFADPLLPLETDTPQASAGYYQLRWEPAAVDTRLVEAADPSFAGAQVIYAGPDTARLISGKPDGDYYYRLESAATRGAGGATVVSETLKVTVEHHSMARAFSFFAVGAAVFAATLGLIVVGGRNERG